MAKSTKKLRVFVASPSDVTAERDKLATVINELNTTLAALLPTKPVLLELVRWETHTYPALGRPQGIINAQIGEYDVFLGLMWRRFGLSTGVAGSGTEEELRRALKSWHDTGRPHVLFYFSTAPAPPPRTADEIAQLAKVVSFREEVMKLGLVWEYEGPVDFAETVRPHLTSVIGELLKPKKRTRSVSASTPVAARTGQVGYEHMAQTLGNVEVPKGTRIVITEVGPEDAFIKAPTLVVGQVITVDAIRETSDGWFAAVGVMEKPFKGMEEGRLMLFQFRFTLEQVVAPSAV